MALTPRVVAPLRDPDRAWEVAHRLGEDLIRTFMENHGVSRSEALAALRKQAQVGRTPSKVMRGER
ncbi:MAG: hypothetical protein FJ102_18860 [Deltaproteobacteria bacterium]|nr:hypothetical protein [Deltaproteobacteria bacterium]